MAQYQLNLKKGKYGVETDRGKTVIKPLYDTIVLCQDSLAQLAISTLNGEKFLHDLSAKGELLSYKAVRFTEMRATNTKDIPLFINAYDQFGNHYYFEKGIWKYQFLNVNRQTGVGFNGLIAITDSITVYGKHEFNSVQEISSLLFHAGTDSGKIAVNLEGQVAYPHVVDRIYRVYDSDSTFICGKRNKWGFFTLDGEYSFPLAEMEDGDLIFNMDGDSYGSIHQNYLLKRNGKWGMVDDKNEVLWEFKYDEFIQTGTEVDYATRIGDTWTFQSFIHEKIAEITCDRFILVDGNYIVYMNDNELKFYDWKEKQEYEGINLTKEECDYSIYSDYKNTYGVITNEGKVQTSFDYSFIELKNEYSKFPFLVARQNGKLGAFDIEGRVLLALSYDRISMICYDDSTLLEIKKNGYVAIGKLNYETRSIDFLTDFIFKEFRCHRIEREKSLGILYDKNGSEEQWLNRDGSITEHEQD